MAISCLLAAPTLDDPLTITGQPGTINLKLTGTVVFDLAQTDVITVAGDKVTFKCTAQTLSFIAVAGTDYFLEMMHAGTMDTSHGSLQEDCPSAMVLATLSAAGTFARFRINVANPAVAPQGVGA